MSAPVFAEATWLDSEWELVHAGVGSSTAEQDETTGSPAPSRRISHSFTGDGFLRTLHKKPTATYNLASGAITGLDFSIDFRKISAPSYSNAIAFGLLVYQGSKVFRGPSITATSTTWGTYSRENLTSESFTEIDGISDDFESHPDFSVAGGTITFGLYGANQNSGGTSYTKVFCLDNATVTLQTSDVTAIVGDPTDRYRLNVSADSRSLLASARAVPFDASASVNLPAAVGLLPQQVLYPVGELTRNAQAAAYDAAFFPRAVQNRQQERQYDGITILTLMRDAFPAPEIGEVVDDLGLPDGRASTLISYLFSRWEEQFPWFTYETVPDLRYPVPGGSGIALPSEYTTALGVVTTPVVVSLQDEDTRRSCYDILEDLLSPFPGTVFFQNASGRLQIVPVYGPDADTRGTPHKTIEDWHAVDVSMGEPSVGTIYNRARVGSRGYIPSDAVSLMQPAWFQFGPTSQFGSTNWYEPPVDRLNLQETGTGTVLQETLSTDDWFGAQSGFLWPQSSSTVPDGTGIGLRDTDTSPLVTVGWKKFTRGDSVPNDSGTDGLTINEDVILMDGTRRTTLTWEKSFSGVGYTRTPFITIRCEWRPEERGVRITFGVASLSYNTITNTQDVIVEFTLNDRSGGYEQTTGPSAVFGVVGDTDPIPGEDGVDAVAASQAAYGVRELRVDVEGYVLSAVQALEIARGLVLANLTPRAIREVELGSVGSTQVLLDDRGRIVGMPDGGEGLLVGATYSDDFISGSWSKRLRVEETIPGTAGYIPTDVSWLLDDDFSYWVNDDESLTSPA